MTRAFSRATLCYVIALIACSRTSYADNPPKMILTPAAQRILARVDGLKKTIPQLEQLKPAGIGEAGATLYFERGVTWKLDDPTKPADKINGRIAEFEPGGFWFRLYFYNGPWGGAAVFKATDLGENQNLWFSYGYRPGDDAAVIGAISKIIEEERPRVEKKEKASEAKKAGD